MSPDIFNLSLIAQRSWLEVAFVVCLFWLATCKSDRIHSPGMFRFACILFALAIIAPAAVSLFVLGGKGMPSYINRAAGETAPSFGWTPLIAPSLLAFSFLAAIFSVFDSQHRTPPNN